MNELNLRSYRARKARLAARTGKSTPVILLWLAAGCLAAGLLLMLSGGTRHPAYAALAIGLLAFMIGSWLRYDIRHLPPLSPGRSLDDVLEPSLLAAFGTSSTVTPRSAWQAALKTWQGRFVVNRLLLHDDLIAQTLTDDSAAMLPLWEQARQLAAAADNGQLAGGALATAIIIGSPGLADYLAALNLQADDIVEVYHWQARLNGFINKPKAQFGGIGRDWATGYTPMLERFGHNVSLEVETGGGSYHTLAHATILDSVVHNLGRGGGSVALVGASGVGKTSLVYALAERLLGGHDADLRYYQIFSLNAAQILSTAGNQLERIMLSLLAEAVHARNIIIFLDDARLFFGSGTGAFDIGQVLMPILKNRSVKLIATFTPGDFQRLKTANETLANGLNVVTVAEPLPADVMSILEDTALTVGHRADLLVTYDAVREAYRLSGQYLQELAYPGKAIDLLEQAVPYAEGKVMTAASIQTGLETTRGFKVAKATAPEADVLLHLEDLIHRRMINQTKAVSAVAAALRRGRAGVANPDRPVGGFLFLGPTGVGKTELARSLAAAYYGDEHNMIRLDMTEFQRPGDVDRLLSAGQDETKSLIMSIREQPFSVVLFDEVEKAHPNVLNLLLQILDEGRLTDQTGKPASFRNAIIINTSNAGSAEISQQVAAGGDLAGFERPLIEQLMAQGIFRPELINRYDEIVLFRPLNQSEMAQVATLMIDQVNANLAKQNVRVNLTDAAVAQIVAAGYDPTFGARPMRRVIQKKVEDAVATRILSGQVHPGDTVQLDVADLPPDD